MGDNTVDERIPWWARDIQRRIGKLEDLRPDVVADRVDKMAEEVRSLRRSFYTFAFSVVGSTVVFAFTVFALLGGRP